MELSYYDDFYFDFIKFQFQYYSKALRANEQIIYKDIGFPQELILAAGFHPVIIESASGLLPPSILYDELLGKSEKYFYDIGTCSFNRLAFAALDNEVMRLPQNFVAINACKEVSNNFRVLAEKYSIPLFLADLPYMITPDSINYLASQYETIFSELCLNKDPLFCLEHLKEIIEFSNQATFWFRKGNELRKHLPAVIYGGQMLRFLGLIMHFGTKDAVDIAHSYYEVCQYKLSDQTKYLKAHCRLLWCNMGITYDNSLFEHIEKKLGAIIAFEEINEIPWDNLDPEKPFHSLAKKTLQTNFLGNVNRRADFILKIVRDYHIDGVIFFSHQNCRMFNPKFQNIKEILSNNSIPIIEVNGDCLDRKTYNKAQILTRIEAFVEMIS